jgi:hypothetical protein
MRYGHVDEQLPPAPDEEHPELCDETSVTTGDPGPFGQQTL